MSNKGMDEKIGDLLDKGKPMTASQIAERLKVHRLTIYRWIKSMKRAGWPIRTKPVRENATGPKAKGYFL